MQVTLNTRIDLETRKLLDEHVERTKESIASITDKALLEYLKKERSDESE